MTTIKDFEYALKELGFEDTTPEEYYSDLTIDYKIEYSKDFSNFSAHVSITDDYIRILAFKGSKIDSYELKVRVFINIVTNPIVWITKILKRLSKGVL